MKQKRSVKKLRTHAGNFLFLFPAMLLYCFVVIVPFIQGIPYSFTNRASVVSQSYDFVGLRNYMELITNKYFQQAFFHTVQFTVIYVIGANVLGLALALMLSRSSRFNNLARTIMFIPFTVALTSGAIVWSYRCIFSSVSENESFGTFFPGSSGYGHYRHLERYGLLHADLSGWASVYFRRIL